jgi:hypothetical protein
LRARGRSLPSKNKKELLPRSGRSFVVVSFPCCAKEPNKEEEEN